MINRIKYIITTSTCREEVATVYKHLWGRWQWLGSILSPVIDDDDDGDDDDEDNGSNVDVWGGAQSVL